MRIENLPDFVMRRLLKLEEDARHAAARVPQLAAERQQARTAWDQSPNTQEYEIRQEALLRIQHEHGVAEMAARKAQETASAVRYWLKCLPDDTTLVEAEVPKPTALDVAQVKERISACQDELEALKSAPIPSSDLRERITDYVRALASEPTVTGIGANEDLQITWNCPASHRVDGFTTHSHASPLPMLVTLLGEEFVVEQCLRRVEQDIQTPLPPDQRPQRIAELERLLEELDYQLAALGSLDASSPAILGVRIATTRRRAA
jgi:hypothetical protein